MYMVMVMYMVVVHHCACVRYRHLLCEHAVLLHEASRHEARNAKWTCKSSRLLLHRLQLQLLLLLHTRSRSLSCRWYLCHDNFIVVIIIR